MPFTETRANKKLRKELKQTYANQNAPCYLCGQPINYAAPAHHPDSCELDHLMPTSTHPHLEADRANIRPTHSSCNRARQNGAPAPTLGSLSRTW